VPAVARAALRETARPQARAPVRQQRAYAPVLELPVLAQRVAARLAQAA